jgi:hypothetical protein
MIIKRMPELSVKVRGRYGTSETRMEARTGDRETLDIKC